MFRILPRLAATLEAVMESGFTLIVWVSAVVTAPADRQHWVDLFISTALTGAAWALAESYRGKSWARTRHQNVSRDQALTRHQELARHQCPPVSDTELSLRDRPTPH